MRILFFVLLLYCLPEKSAAQSFFLNSLDTSQELPMKSLKVKEKFFFQYTGKKDSSLMDLHRYNAAGKKSSITTPGEEGRPSAKDSFIYDHKNFLKEQISYKGNNVTGIQAFKSDAGGRITEAILSDSSHHFISNTRWSFDENGRVLKISITTNQLNETYTMTRSYSQSGKTLVINSHNTQTGISEVEKLYYNKNGKVEKRTYDNVILSQFKYNSKGQCIEELYKKVIPAIGLNQNIRTLFSYYPNGLLNEVFSYIDNEPAMRYKYYYHYYQD